ncbi:unnamed protein product, partial [marine sediment metagenome]
PVTFTAGDGDWNGSLTTVNVDGKVLEVFNVFNSDNNPPGPHNTLEIYINETVVKTYGFADGHNSFTKKLNKGDTISYIYNWEFSGYTTFSATIKDEITNLPDLVLSGSVNSNLTTPVTGSPKMILSNVSETFLSTLSYNMFPSSTLLSRSQTTIKVDGKMLELKFNNMKGMSLIVSLDGISTKYTGDVEIVNINLSKSDVISYSSLWDGTSSPVIDFVSTIKDQ